jgi:hypothetical protein
VKFEDAKVIEANDYLITKQRWEIEELQGEKTKLERQVFDLMIKRIDVDVERTNTSANKAAAAIEATRNI